MHKGAAARSAGTEKEQWAEEARKRTRNRKTSIGWISSTKWKRSKQKFRSKKASFSLAFEIGKFWKKITFHSDIFSYCSPNDNLVGSDCYTFSVNSFETDLKLTLRDVSREPRILPDDISPGLTLTYEGASLSTSSDALRFSFELRNLPHK